MNVLPSVAAIAIYRNPVTRAMRNVEAFSQAFTNRPPNPLVTPRSCGVTAAHKSPVPAWLPRPCPRGCRRRTSAGFRPDAVKPGIHYALDPGFHWVPTGPAQPDRGVDGSG